VGILFFVRVTSMMVSGPFFSNTAIQLQSKLALSASVAILMTVAFAADQPPITVDAWALVPVVFKEVFIGVALGWSAGLLFQAVRMAGGLVDMDMGFQTALLFNPQADVPTLVGEVKSLALLMVYIALDGHLALLEATYASVEVVPLGMASFGKASLDAVTGMVVAMFIIGLKIAAPLLIALFITNLALALLSKVAPQINVFTLSFQFKIAVGLLVLFASVPLFVFVSKNAISTFQRDTLVVLKSLAPTQQGG
jgi:flagellar biosynthetic protein FliR